MFKKAFVAMITLFFSNAHAVICDGVVTSVAVQKEGSLLVRQAILMAAQKSGSSVRLYMRDPSHTCTLADWSVASVYFVEDLG